jgi:hypothetical protein
MRLSISEILDLVSKAPNRTDRVELLRKHDNGALRTILKYALDPNIKFVLPEGEPPYKPCAYVGQETMLYREARKLYLFIEGGNDNLNPIRRETLFIQLLESIDPKDAKLLLAMKDKKMPYKGINMNVVNDAFPGMFYIEKANEQVEEK